ncbi:PREDICTED: uncharacterized protein LOC106812732 isoform X2 [Priapulus caudatus]|uniref:Uncharacterized protein LOC106812732 isoform X2 n=1 Tax=Priapulus caudatus TaxID=37621 RepID=A0ABM1EJ19_PRICU|nr:PREDICTED: uncharacterized protein LOC106812732 isoform X2 [Priapulus caudatus]
MENLRKHLSFGGSNFYKVSKSVPPVTGVTAGAPPVAAEGLAQFHAVVAPSMQADVQEIAVSAGSFVDELNALCGAGSQLVLKLAATLKLSPYSEAAGQLQHALTQLCQAVSGSGSHFRSELESSLRTLRGKLKSPMPEDERSPENLKLIAGCLVSFIQLQCQLCASAQEVLERFSRCTTPGDLASSPTRTPDPAPRNPAHASMPSLAGQAEQMVQGRPPSGKSRDSLQRAASTQSLPAGDDAAQKKRHLKLVGKVSGGGGGGQYHAPSPEYAGDAATPEAEAEQKREGRETRQGNNRVHPDVTPAGDEIQDVIDFLSGCRGQQPQYPQYLGCQMENIPEHELQSSDGFRPSEIMLRHRTLATSYSNRSAEMRKRELGVATKPPDPGRQTWPRMPQRDDPYGAYGGGGGGESSNEQMEFQQYMKSVQHMTLTSGHPYGNQFYQSLFQWPHPGSLDPQKIWTPQPNSQHWAGSLAGSGQEKDKDSGSSSDETSSYNGHDGDVFAVAGILAGPDLLAAGSHRRRHSSSDGIGEGPVELVRRKSVDDLRMEAKSTNTWPPQQVWGKTGVTASPGLMPGAVDASGSTPWQQNELPQGGFTYLPTSFGQLT